MKGDAYLTFLETIAKGAPWNEAMAKFWFDLRAVGIEKIEGQTQVWGRGIAMQEGSTGHFKSLEMKFFDGQYRVYTRFTPTEEQLDGVRFLTAVDALIHDHERLKEAALHDPLTGCLNRKGLQEWFEDRVRRYPDVGFLIVMLDLDNFKQLNDTKGHAKGDEALVAVSHSLRSQLRSRDVLARIGGDEFVFIMEMTSCVAGVRERLESIVQKLPLMTYQIGMTMGVAIYPTHGHEMHQLLAKADSLLYQGKRRGKNRIVMEGESSLDQTACG